MHKIKNFTLIVACMFFVSCAGNEDIENTDEEMNQNEAVENADGEMDQEDGILEDPTEASSVNEFENILQEITEELLVPESEVVCTQNSEQYVYRFVEGDFTCNYPGAEGATCICEIYLNDSIVAYARNDRQWCQTQKGNILGGSPIAFGDGGTRSDHIGMNCQEQ